MEVLLAACDQQGRHNLQWGVLRLCKLREGFLLSVPKRILRTLSVQLSCGGPCRRIFYSVQQSIRLGHK